MSRKFPRLLFVASLVAGASLAPMLGAHAQDTRAIDVKGNKFGANGTANAAGITEAYKGDDVIWTVLDGEHTVTPEEPEKWGGSQGSPTLKPGEPKDSTWTFQFTLADTYRYYCEIHGRDTMSGTVKVIDPNATTTTTAPPNTTPPPPPTTATTRPVVPTTAPPASSAGTKTLTPPPPAPTTTTAKSSNKDKDKKPKEEETTTTTAPPPPPPPIDLPDSAIVPPLPGFDSPGTTTQSGIEAPEGTPEGDAVALLRSGKGGGGDAKKLLIVSGIGLGVLGFGAAGYKYANRSSKYFPA